MPRDVVELADRTVRASGAGPQVADLIIGSVGWLAPPEHGLVLAYRSGDEEGSCQRDVSVAMVSGDVEVKREIDC